MYDLEYKTSGLFTIFIPNTKAGEDAWRVMANENGGNATYLTIHLQSILSQLRKAGYSVGKAKKAKINDDDLLAELGV